MSRTPIPTDREQALLPDLCASERHRLLVDDRRRRLCAVLAERGAPLDIEEVAFDLISQGETTTGAETAATEEVLIDLHHVQLPMLAEAGVLVYDPETNRIERNGVAADA